MKKKLFVIVLAAAMIMSFAACGGNSGDSGEAASASAEPNTGIQGIVFAVPDDWTLAMSEVDSYLQYDTQDSGYIFSASTFNAEDLATMENADEFSSVQDFYEKQFLKEPDTEGKGYTNEITAIKVCGKEGKYVKAVRDDKETFEVSTFWMMDDVIYTVGLFYPMEYDEDGNPTTDIASLPPISGDLMKAYDGVVASIQAGDGTSLQPDGLQVDSLGSLSFDVPEGYSVTDASDNSVFMVNRDNGNMLNFHITDQEAFDQMGWEGEGVPTTLDEYFDMMKIDAESVEIAGTEGFINNSEAEDGNVYDINAAFRVDDVIYEASLSADAWDENGLKADAVPLSDDDKALFRSFLASIAKK